VKVTEFKYELPGSLIAQEPAADRAAARMLHLARNSEGMEERKDTSFLRFPDLLRPDDLVVFNNTRVFPARLFGRRSSAKAQPVSPQNPAAKDFLQGKIEALLTQQISRDPNEWECLMRPGRKIGVGEQLYFGDRDELTAEVISRGEFGERTIRFAPVQNFWSLVESVGHIPLPPYIDREDRSSDHERYQTVYARERGSVAAPTAGLHFTPEILKTIHARGIETTEVTLHVGLGTFQPMRVDEVEAVKLHREAYYISEAAANSINTARKARRRIVAIGTTTVRTLEYAALQGEIKAEAGYADLFIYPGFQFQITGAMLTNFHLPQSTLLMLVCAFGGKEKVLAAYRHAVEKQYRFYSYGDCMFVE
jgi:S-adenosylmethionine:tRNA ribosyltransferase-isomerase